MDGNGGMLPTDFTLQDAIQQAQVLGVGNKTIDRWLQKVSIVMKSSMLHMEYIAR